MPHPSSNITYQAIVHSSVGATASGATVDVTGLSALGINVSGLTTGTLAPQVSNDNSTWSSIPVSEISTGSNGTILTASGNYRTDVSGFRYLKIPITAFTTGTINVGINAQPNAGGVANPGSGLSAKYSTPANIAPSQTDSTIVGSISAKKIRVLAFYAIPGATATDLTLNSKGTGSGTPISAKFANGANGGEVLPYSPVGWFETATGESLTVTTGAGATTGLGVVYAEV